MFIHQQPHQFRDRHRGMGIVELHHILVGEMAELIAIDQHPTAHNVL